jgi:hypothetical protein
MQQHTTAQLFGIDNGINEGPSTTFFDQATAPAPSPQARVLLACAESH